jgi:hypothetical protein
MYTQSLPSLYVSGDDKGKTAIVKIANEKLGFPADKNDKETALRIQQDRFKFPQFGAKPEVDEKGDEVALSDDAARLGIEEYITNTGSVQRALEILNDVTRDAAVFDAKTYIRTTVSGEVNSVVEAGLNKSLNFTWKATERVSVKEFKSTIDELKARALAGPISNDEIAEIVRKSLGL